jgi:hypothetical protein
LSRTNKTPSRRGRVHFSLFIKINTALHNRSGSRSPRPTISTISRAAVMLQHHQIERCCSINVPETLLCRLDEWGLDINRSDSAHSPCNKALCALRSY